MHHRGHLGIEGNADDPDGHRLHRPLETTDSPGPVHPRCPRHPPDVAARKAGIPTPTYRHPTGERIDPRAAWFGDPIPA